MKSKNKIKKKVLNNLTYLEMKGEKYQQLDPVQVEAITKKRVEGLLPMQVQNSGKTFKLIYNITGLESLKSYLSRVELNKQLFGFLLQNIFNIIDTLDKNYFRQEGLLLTYTRVKIEPATKRLYFMYVPIQMYDNETSLRDFLRELIHYAHFAENNDNSYVQEYIRILNNGVNFSKFELQEYINSLASNRNNVSKFKKCPNCGKRILEDANFCTQCHYSFISGGITGPTETSFYDPAKTDGVRVIEANLNGNAQSDSGELKWGTESSKTDTGSSKHGGTSIIGENMIDSTDSSIIAPPIDEAEPEKPNDSVAEKARTSNNIKEKSETELFASIPSESDTIVLNEDSEPPNDLAEQHKKIVKSGYLTRLSNNEKREIGRDLFTVGRSLKNDFSVPDNGAVGRLHLVFRILNNRFYIVDQNSKNKTYVNSKAIAPSVNVEVFDKTRIKLANEEFVFNVLVKEI